MTIERQDRPPRRNKRCNPTNIETLLRGLQNDIELFGDERLKQRRRVLLKGFRAGLWTASQRPMLGEVAQALRAELFGYSLPVMTDDDEELCHPGTDDDEVM